MKKDESATGAGCLRGFVLMSAALPLAILVGFSMKSFMYGLFAFAGCVIVAIAMVNNAKKLQLFDCGLPLLISVICGITFMPVAIISGNLFSPISSLWSGAMFSICLFLWRTGRVPSELLILPGITFVYECLPVDLPTDIDNFIGVIGSTVCTFKAFAKYKCISHFSGSENSTPANQLQRFCERSSIDGDFDD